LCKTDGRSSRSVHGLALAGTVSLERRPAARYQLQNQDNDGKD